METRADVFASTRPLLFSIAYRMLGSVMDLGHDIVKLPSEAGLETVESGAVGVRDRCFVRARAC